MTYLETNFRDFVKTHLIEETKKPTIDKALNENKPDHSAWMELMKIEFEEIMKGYDDIQY